MYAAHPHSAPHGWSSRAIADAGGGARLAAHARIAALTILLVPVHWLLGTSLVWGYGAAFLFMLGAARWGALEWLFASFYAALGLGLSVAVLNGESGDRIAAALYNLSIAFVLLAFINCGRRVQAGGQPAMSAAIYRAAYICFAVYIAYFACLHVALRFLPPSAIEMPSLIVGLAGTLPGVLGEYSRVDIALTDWTHEGPVWRIVGFGIYATEGAILLTLIGILASLHALRQGYRMRAVAIEMALAAALVLMASRTTLGAYALSLGLTGALLGRRVFGPALIAAPIGIAVLALAAIYGPGLLAASFDAINEARAGSSGERFKAYGIAIDMTLNSNIWTGLGIKPRDPSLASIPIGSHSTFVGAFTKGGLIALSLLVLVYAATFFKLAQAQARVYAQAITGPRAIELVFLSRAVLVVFMWWLTEDFDAPVQTAALAGLCIGLFSGLLEHASRNARHSWPAMPAMARGWR